MTDISGRPDPEGRSPGCEAWRTGPGLLHDELPPPALAAAAALLAFSLGALVPFLPYLGAL